MFLTSLNKSVAASGGGASSGIINPISAKSISELIANVVDIFVQVSIPIITVGIVYVGFLFVSAQGNTGKISAAREALKWTLLGAALVLGAKVISSAIQATFSQMA